MPFWFSVTLLILLATKFKYFYEASILFLLSDLLFGVKEGLFGDFLFNSFLISLILIFATEFIKRKLRYHKNEK